MSARFTLRLAALLGALSVGIGAFGAHALKPLLDATGRGATFETAVRYQFYHTLALLALAVLQTRTAQPERVAPVVWCWLTGIVVFSGSLYALVLTGQTWLGAVTPLGGAAFIGGWVLLAVRTPALLPDRA